MCDVFLCHMSYVMCDVCMLLSSMIYMSYLLCLVYLMCVFVSYVFNLDYVNSFQDVIQRLDQIWNKGRVA
jgi:hypothetical protein